MKKLFLLICLVFSLTSCVTPIAVADITTFSPNGEILCEYKNIQISKHDFKSNGNFEFYDGARYVILPTSLPYIIKYIWMYKGVNNELYRTEYEWLYKDANNDYK